MKSRDEIMSGRGSGSGKKAVVEAGGGEEIEAVEKTVAEPVRVEEAEAEAVEKAVAAG